MQIKYLANEMNFFSSFFFGLIMKSQILLVTDLIEWTRRFFLPLPTFLSTFFLKCKRFCRFFLSFVKINMEWDNIINLQEAIAHQTRRQTEGGGGGGNKEQNTHKETYRHRNTQYTKKKSNPELAICYRFIHIEC